VPAVISLPSEILPGDTWDGMTGFDRHLDSSMDFEEHQRITFDALQLLAGPMAVADNAAGRKLEQLKDAYEGHAGGDVLYISKGIHQPNTNPHMQLRLKRGNGVWYTYHLNVHVSDDGIQGLPQCFFHWVGVQFAAEADTVPDGKVQAYWPLVATQDTKYRHPRRRMSIAPKNVQATIEAIARALREEQERQDRIEQARVKEQGRALGRNAIQAKLKALNYTIPGNANAGLNKLYDGESIKILTKNRKEMLVRYNGANVVNV
jgi:hypothetical protein